MEIDSRGRGLKQYVQARKHFPENSEHNIYFQLGGTLTVLQYNIQNMLSSPYINEPPRGKTNNVVSEQVRHKPACTSTEKS